MKENPNKLLNTFA